MGGGKDVATLLRLPCEPGNSRHVSRLAAAYRPMRKPRACSASPSHFMPCGKRTASAVRRPSAVRFCANQQSSLTKEGEGVVSKSA